jgi:hypothetical protein
MLIAVEMEDTPARCSGKTAKFADALTWAILSLLADIPSILSLLRFPTVLLVNNSISGGVSNQNLILFTRENATPGAPIINGF